MRVRVDCIKIPLPQQEEPQQEELLMLPEDREEDLNMTAVVVEVVE